MKNKFLKTIFAPLAMACMIGGCGASDGHSDDIAEAKAAFEAGNFRRVQIICDHIAADTVSSNLSCRQLCNLSLLYMELAEACPDSAEVNVASATDIFRRAYKENPDSVIEYFQNLSSEEVGKSQIVMNLNSVIYGRSDSIGLFEDEHDSFPDSIYKETDTYCYE